MARAPSSKGRSPKERAVAEANASDSVGALYAVPLRGGRWGVVQQLASKSHDRLVALDWYGKAPPAVAALARAGVLQKTHRGWNGEPAVTNATKGSVPTTWRLLGTAKPRTVRDTKTYGPAEVLTSALEHQWDWDQLPKAAVAAYAKATRTDPKRTVSISIGGPARDVPLRRTRLVIRTGGDIEPPPSALRNWSALDALPGLWSLEVEGSAPGLCEYLASRPLISVLEWTSPPAKIDLSRTHVESVRLRDVEAATRLALSPKASDATITLAPRGGVVTIDLPESDRPFDLFVGGSPERVVLPRRLASLRVEGPPSVDVAALLARCPELQSLTVGRGGPGLTGLAALTKARGLEDLVVVDRWDLDPAEIGPLPKTLRRVELSGVRKSRLAALNAAFGGVAQLDIRGVRADATLDARRER